MTSAIDPDQLGELLLRVNNVSYALALKGFMWRPLGLRSNCGKWENTYFVEGHRGPRVFVSSSPVPNETHSQLASTQAHTSCLGWIPEAVRKMGSNRAVVRTRLSWQHLFAYLSGSVLVQDWLV